MTISSSVFPASRRAQLVDEDSDYGRIVCRCELVTRKEVLQAIRNPLGVNALTGIKYRSRAMMGRCQGGFCTPRIVEMLGQETHIPLTDVTLRGPDSRLFIGATKELRDHAD